MNIVVETFLGAVLALVVMYLVNRLLPKSKEESEGEFASWIGWVSISVSILTLTVPLLIIAKFTFRYPMVFPYSLLIIPSYALVGQLWGCYVTRWTIRTLVKLTSKLNPELKDPSCE